MPSSRAQGATRQRAPGRAPGEAPRLPLPGPPPFPDPEHYLEKRWGGLRGLWKGFGERRALARCLRAVTGPGFRVGLLCDCPCGPGRLFSFWSHFGFCVLGVDSSSSMVAAARARLAAEELPGSVVLGDVRDLPRLLPTRPEVVACIRFAYYLDPPARVDLLRTLAGSTQRWLIVQYKTTETRRGRRCQAEDRNRGKFASSDAGIAREARAAGLRLAGIERIGQGSDRVFAVLERSSRGAEAAG